MPPSLINSDGSNHKLNYQNGLFKINYLEYMSGLVGTKYTGYHNDDPLWFVTATPETTSTFNSIDNFSSSPDYVEQDYYSWEWVGFFKPTTTEVYTFYTDSDDGSYLWVGENAVTGYSVENAVVNNGGPHGPVEANGSVSLTANTYYPIRIQFGEIGGGDIITVSFSTDSISKTTNGLGYYFHS